MIYENTKYEDRYGARWGTGQNYANYLHSFTDFDLLPRRKPIIEPPKPKTNTVDIPGADGSLDLSEVLTSSIHYSNRKGTFEYVYTGPREGWDVIYHRLLGYLHGKTMRCIIDDDNGGYYEGRWTVKAPQYANDRMYITVEGDLEPYRYDLYTSTEPWIWDTFEFATGVIRDYAHVTVDIASVSSITTDARAIVLLGSEKPVVPNIILESGSVSVAYYAGGTLKTVNLTSGSNISQTPDLVVQEDTTIYVWGTGTFSIEYRGGLL